MAEFKTPVAKRRRSRLTDNPELQTPIKIPASPFLKQIGYGCGVTIFTLERSPRVGFARSPWAIKKRNKNVKKDVRFAARLKMEAEILRKLKHPNIIGFKGLAFEGKNKKEPCLIMEKLDISLGDLIEEKVEQGGLQFSVNKILKIGCEIAKGLKYLHHTAYILHGDMKSFNILLSRNYKTVKICDFGVSIPLTEDLEIDKTSGQNYVGTACWTAPEILNDDGPVTNKADIWSYGLVLWEMIALSPPHIHNKDEDKNINSSRNTDEELEDSFLQTLNDPNESKYGTRPPLPAIKLGPEYGKLLELFYACTNTNYRMRPNAKGIVRFFNYYVYNITKDT